MLNNDTVSCRMIRACLDHASTKGIDLEELITRHGYSYEWLEDSYNWVSIGFFNDLVSRLESASSKHPVAFEIGTESTSKNSWGDIENVIKAIGNAKPILMHFDRFLAYFLKYQALKIIASDETSITVRSVPAGNEYKNAGEFITGAIISLPRLWGGDDLSAVRMRDESLRINFSEEPCFFDTANDFKKFSPKLLEEIIHGLEKTKKMIEKKNHELEKKNSELEKAYKKLEASINEKIQSEKLATLGGLSIGIAHEINNPLSFIISNFRTLKKYTEALKSGQNSEEIIKDIPQLIDETEEGLLRVKKIVEDINYIAHPGDNSKTPADISELIKNTLRITKSMHKDSISIEEKYEHRGKLLCSPSRISQVILNLLMNSAQAIKEKGFKEGQGVIKIHTSEENGNINIRISDNGTGIKKEDLKRLTEPFFTTKKAGEGTGLGLSTANAIILAHNGTMVFESHEGQGTTVTIRIPLNGTTDIDKASHGLF